MQNTKAPAQKPKSHIPPKQTDRNASNPTRKVPMPPNTARKQPTSPKSSATAGGKGSAQKPQTIRKLKEENTKLVRVSSSTTVITVVI
jgi:hypothetical protein